MHWFVWPIGAAIIGLPLGFALMAAAQRDEACPDKLGWMDHAAMTDADRSRIQAITGAGRPDDNNTGALAVIRSMQSGSKSGIACRDIELLRQDRRRARAAYPDIKPGDLFEGVWLQIDLKNRIPESYNISANSSGTMVDGKWYYDGPVYVSRVRSTFPNRATAEETAAWASSRP